MPYPVPNRSLHRFALLTAASTLALVCVGGLVTSHGVGMSVPDWPNTYGYNMFFFPFSRWVGGIFYEHTHRLLASAVGLLTSLLAVWLYGRKARPLLRWGGMGLNFLGLGIAAMVPAHWRDALVLCVTGLVAFGASLVWPQCEPAPVWLRRCGLAAFFAVVLQGVLGGLRVVLLEAQIGIFHATLAQLFFALTCSIALFTSPWWLAQDRTTTTATARESQPGLGLRGLLLGTTLLILTQLILGATMRHQHAGLAIPDFPLAYGKLWPAMDPAAVASYNQHRLEVTAANPITAAQIVLQMVHRFMAVLILAGVGLSAWLSRRRPGAGAPVSRLTATWLGLILVQVLLGAATIWSNKAADIATAHVLVGALALALGTLLNLVAARQFGWALRRQTARSTAVEPDSLAGLSAKSCS